MSTIPLNTRIDIRDLATLVRFYKDQGAMMVSRSGLLRRALQDYIQILVSNEKVDPSTDVEQSLLFLRENRFILGNSLPTKSVVAEMARESKDKGVYIAGSDDIAKKVVKKMEENDGKV